MKKYCIYVLSCSGQYVSRSYSQPQKDKEVIKFQCFILYFVIAEILYSLTLTLAKHLLLVSVFLLSD